VAAAVFAVAAVAGVVFLFFGSTGSQLTSPIAQAASLSSNAGGFRMRMAIEMTSPQLPSPVTADASGVVDVRDRAASMSFAMNLGSDPQAVQVLGSDTLRMQMVLDGSTFYVKLPAAATAALPVSGKQWLKLDFTKLKGFLGPSSLGGDPTLQDPSHVLQVLESESSNVVNEGKQRVDGFDTTHYRAYLDLSHLASNISPSQQSAAQDAISAFERATKSQNIPVDVWIDPYGFVRRMVMSMDLSLPNGGSMQEAITADFSDYGPQRRPAVPPADQVQNLGSLIHVAGT
jgi:hypothetical protein